MYVMYSRELARDASRHSRDNQLQAWRCNNDGSLCGVVDRPRTVHASVLGVLLRRQTSSILSKWSPPVQRHHIRITTRNTNVYEIIKMQLIHLYTEADLGMFMFGRTGAPTKRGPHKRTWAENNHVITKYSVTKMSDNLNNFVALNSSYSTPSVLNWREHR